MFVHRFDSDHGLAVWLFTGPTNTEEDFQRYIEVIDETDAAAAGKEKPAVILIVDPGNPIPNAKWRSKIAEASRVLRSKPMFCMVSASAIARGVVTAINWIRPPPYEVATRSSFQEACDWIEAARGPSPRLFGLLEECRNEAKKHGL